VLGCLLTCLLGGAVQAAGWSLRDDSRFGFRAVVEGEPFEARFERFAVVPQIGPRRLPDGFEVQVDLRAIDSRNRDRDAEMQSAEWFDVANHPYAGFRSTTVEGDGEGGLVTRGELTIKGVTQPIAVPFSWRLTADGATMRGQVEIDRRRFSVGPDDVSGVDATVTVFFDLEWQRP
jgi:polyisoprenoid-binding protein YceI